MVVRGDPGIEIPKLAKNHHIESVYSNEAYDTYGVQRDFNVKKTLAQAGIGFEQFVDYLLLPLSTVEKSYKVFTPFFRKWETFLPEQFNLQRIQKISSISQEIPFDLGKQ